MTTEMIGGVDATAPLWNKTDPRELRAIVAAFSDASYHYADDSGGEWGRAATVLRHAAMAINAANLGFYAIQCLHRDKPQLVALDQVMDAVLKDARAMCGVK